MNYELKIQTDKAREQLVVKANEVVRKARYQLNLTELKIMQFCFSKIKPTDTVNTEYNFTIKEFCMVCGIDYTNGRHYNEVKRQLKGLRDKSMWILQDDGSESTVGWLGKVNISQGSGNITVKFDEDMSKYINGLLNNYTQYTFLNILPMKSAYSVRLYELLKSYAFTYTHEFEVEELKKLIMCDHYTNFAHFRQKVIEPAIIEINRYTDLNISWKPIKFGAKVTHVKFYMNEKTAREKAISVYQANEKLEGQLNLEDYYK